MADTKPKPAPNNGAAWPLRYVADPEVAAINPNYTAETGKAYPFVPMENIREHCEGLSGFETRVLDSGGYTFFQNGDILFAKITPCTENGKIARVQGLSAEVGFGSTEFIVVSPKPSVDERFLYYQLTRGDVRALCASLMEGSTGRQRVPASIFRKRIQIPVPPDRREQTAVADALEMVDHIVAAARESIAKAERLQKGLMQQMLTGHLRPDGSLRRKNDFSEHHKLGWVPRGWLACRVREIATKVTDGEHATPQRTSSGYYLLSARNVGPGRLLLQDVDFVAEDELLRIRKRCDPEEGDLLISCSGTIGNVCLVPPGLVCGMVRSAALVKLERDKCVPKFLEWLFRATPMQRQMQASASVSIQGNLFQGSIRRLWITLPSNQEEQIAISAKLDSTEELILAKEAKIVALQRLKKSLMQNLLTGRIRLPLPKEGRQES
jgi:type I restriction enzyme, S subunit